MGIKYGMPSLIEYQNLEDNIKLCHKLGLDFVEINMSMLYCLPEYNEIDKIVQLKEKYKIDFTMHFPEDIDFGTFHKEIQDANIALFKRYVAYGKQLGVRLINIHLNEGVKVTLPQKKVYAYEKNKDEYLTHLKDSLEKIVKIASENDIVVCIENVETPEYILEVFIELSKIEKLYFTYDVGHDAKANYNVENIYKKLDNKVKHMHLHDYDHHTDHQILFKGIINLHDRLNFAKKNNMSVVIEVKTVDSLIKSMENLIMRSLI